MATPPPTEKSNSPARLSRLISRAREADSQRTTLDAWAQALGVPEGGTGLDRTHDAADLLTECIEEVRLMKLALAREGVPEPLYSQYVSHVEHALTATNLTSRWDTTIGNYLGSEVMLALAWCAHVLPDDSATASDEDLATLTELLKELERALEVPGLPDFVRTAFSKHLAGMQRALKAFPVRGVKPMREAARAVLADLNIDKDEIREAASTAEKSAMSSLAGSLFKAWKKTAEIAGDADKVIKTGKQLLEFFGDVAEKLPS